MNHVLTPSIQTLHPGLRSLDRQMVLPDARQEPIGSQPNAHGFVAMLAAFRSSGGIERAADLEWLLDDQPDAQEGALSKLIMSGEIFCFEWHDTVWVPMFQFDLREMGVRARPQEVRAALDREFDRWGLAAWFAQRHPGLAHMSPVDMIDVNLPAVLQAARADRGQGRHD